MNPRLSPDASLPASVATPRYDRDALKCGIVHLGVGAFHKAHQAYYTDAALSASGGDWMIMGASLRSADVADQLNPQSGLYTLVERGPDGVSPRIIGAIRNVLVGTTEAGRILEAMVAPETRIVSTTITEKGYGIDPRSGGLDRNHPAVAADLATPEAPSGAVGLIVEALRLRRAAGTPPFTVLCCDNLPENGKVLKRLVLDFANLRDNGLAEWIGQNVTFPSTMVDRITPPSRPETYSEVISLVGCEDRAAVETEPFTQWVLEDRFVAGRPQWEAAGALFVDDVAPYEKMKLRMLNGSHSLLAYSGFIAGHVFVRDVMEDVDLVALITAHMKEVQKTLDPVPGIDLEAYAADLRDRFRNPAIAYQTYQIAMDGTQKLPQRLLQPALAALAAGHGIETYAFAVAAWMRYCLGVREDGERYVLRDPRQAEIEAALSGLGRRPDAIVQALMELPGLFDKELSGSQSWRNALISRLETMTLHSMREAIRLEAGRLSGGGA